jgi:23S rRNA pseudouridine2605 synthase
MFATPANNPNAPKGRVGQGPGAAGAQPDPMKTAFGYIGQDALQRRREEEDKKRPTGGRRRGGGGRSGGR